MGAQVDESGMICHLAKVADGRAGTRPDKADGLTWNDFS